MIDYNSMQLFPSWLLGVIALITNNLFFFIFLFFSFVTSPFLFYFFIFILVCISSDWNTHLAGLRIMASKDEPAYDLASSDPAYDLATMATEDQVPQQCFAASCLFAL